MTVTQCILAVLGILTTWGVFYLNAIRESQLSLVKEIKEMNIDIREMLSRLSAGDVAVKAINQRIDALEGHMENFDNRLHNVEIK